jgi:hypothetical protein
MSEPESARAAEPAPGGDSALSRLWRVLIAPEATFRSIAARPTWALVLLVILALVGVAIYVSFDRIDAQDLVKSMEEQGRQMPPNMTPERLAAITKWTSLGGALVFVPVLYLLTALVFWVALRMFGSDIDYRRSLSVTLHGMLPFGLASLVGIPIALAREHISMTELQSGGLVKSSLGFLVSEDTSKAVQALLTSVDLFSIWSIVLLIIGFRVVGRVARGNATAIVLVVWGIGVLLKVGLAAVFGGG